MREKLNENPLAQVALVGVLVLVAGIMLLKGSGGGEEAEEETSAGVVATVNGATATGGTAGEAVEGAIESLEEGGGVATASGEASGSLPVPALPEPVATAHEAGKTVVLLVVNDGEIDRSLVRAAKNYVSTVSNTALFVVPVRQVARYAAITVGVDLNRVPALLVMAPEELGDGASQASVDYGFQTPASLVQAVRDATYEGPEATYHPD